MNKDLIRGICACHIYSSLPTPSSWSVPLIYLAEYYLFTM